MSRIVGLTLLLIILVDSFYDSTALPAGPGVTKKHIRMCRCRGMIKCHPMLVPTNKHKKINLIKCHCSQINQHKFPKSKAACIPWQHSIPVSLV